MHTEDLTSTQWGEVRTALIQAQNTANQAFTDTEDESLYRQLALSAGVYSREQVAAESELPSTLSSSEGAETNFTFRMQHRIVRTGETLIYVPENNSIIIIRSRGNDCGVENERLRLSRDFDETLPREYKIQLYQPILLGAYDMGYQIPRVFNVNRTEYGIWHHVPSGTYRIRIYRRHSHPMILCGECSFRVVPPSGSSRS